MIDPKEIGNTYVGSKDRYIVSLVVGYRDDAECGATTPEEAASLALELTRDSECNGTHWYVYDRVTGVMHLIEQGRFER